MNRLQAMELFVGTVRTGSFSAAGRRVGLSPASVSRYVGELETQLGVQLFNRSTRHLGLTEAGKIFFQRTEQVLHGIEDAEAAALALQSAPRGTLRVHSRTMFGIKVLSPLMPPFQKLYPDLKVELRLSERRVQLREEEFDVDFQITAPTDPSLMQRRLLRSERILVASPSYVTRMPRLREPDDVVAHDCLTYWMGPDDAIWKFMRKNALREVVVPSAFSSNNGIVLCDLALKGHGIALLDDYTVANELKSGKLVRLMSSYRVTNSTFDEGIYVAFLQSSYLPEKIRVFVDYMAENVPRLIKRSG
jgi:DNA-binding transcriptional LysR family regulator